MKAVGHAFQRGEAIFNQLHKGVMIQISRRRNDHVVGREALAVKIKQLFLLKGADSFFRSQDRLAQRMVLPEILGKDFMHQIIRIIFIHLDLFQDHAFFASDVLGIESGIEN